MFSFKFSGLLASLLIFMACGDGRKPGDAFDLPGFFKSQTDSLKAKGSGVHKIISENGKSSTVVLDSPDFSKELMPFTGINLNLPAHVGKFLTDTVRSDENLSYSLVYSALDASVNLRYVMVDFDSLGRPHRVSIRQGTVNDLYQSSESLNFTVGESYSVERKQTAIPSGNGDFSVYARFVENKRP